MDIIEKFKMWLRKAEQQREEIKRKRQFGTAQQLELLEDLILAIRARQSPNEAMENAYTHCTAKNDVAYRDIYLKMNRGATLSVALNDWFDPIIVLSIKAGESNRRLVQALENAKTTLENQSGVMSKIVKANMYPIILTISGLSANVVVAKLVIEPMFKERALDTFPALTQFSYNFGMFFFNNTGYLILGGYLLIKYMQYVLNNWVGDRRELVDNWIVFRQYRLIMAASFLRSMSVMQKSKETVAKSLEAVYKSSRPYLAEHAQYMKNSISSKVGVGHVMDSGLLEEQEIARIKSITAKSNDNVPELFLRIAERHERLLQKSLDSISRNLNMISILFVALMMLLAFGGQMVAQLANAGMSF